MKKILKFVLIALLLNSCSASWHIKKAKEKQPELFKADTTIETIIQKLDTVIYLDTNIIVQLPRDTVKIEKLIPISRNFDKVTKRQGIITTEVEAIKGMLKVNSYLDSSFIYRLQDSIRIKNAKITKLQKVSINQEITIQQQRTLIDWLKIILFSILGLIVIVIFLKLLSYIKV